MMKTLFRNFIELHRGYDLPKNKRISGDFPIVSSTGIVGKHNSYKVKGPGVITGRSGTIGKVIFEKGCFWPLNTTLFVSDFKGNDPKYVYYWLQCFDLKHYTTGSTVPTLNRNDLSNLIIDVPTINEQRKRREILEILDAKIATNIEISQQLESMVKTIYDYWFLQFEFPDKDGKPYKSNGGKMIWNDQLKQEIPEGWEVKPLKSLINNVKSGAWGKEKEEKDYIQKVNCIRGADFPGLMSSNDLNIPVRYIRTKDGKKLLSNGDLIVEISGGSPTQSTGRISYINSVTLKRFKNPITTSNFCKAISLENKEFQYWFYLTWDNFYRHGIFFNYEGKTTGIKNLMFKSFISTNIIIPDNETMHEFYNKASKIFDEIQYKALENQQLKSLRNFLLPMLMNGQVSISD